MLKNFNIALNVLQVHPKFLALMAANTAKSKVEKELDLFEPLDADAGFGDEEYCGLVQAKGKVSLYNS